MMLRPLFSIRTACGSCPNLPVARMVTLGLLMLGCTMLSACVVNRSPETRYYVLALPDATSTMGQREISGPRVAVGPISLPGYLDRPQLFIREADMTDVRLADYDRWGEPMGEGITRLLAENLSARLAPQQGMATPLRASMPFDWRISVDVSRFDGAPGREVLLDAGWSMSDPTGKTVREGHFVARAPAVDSIDGLVRAHGALLAQLGETLTNAITEALKAPQDAMAAEKKTGSRKRSGTDR